MRNREAARYARWSAVAAGSIALLVIGIYAERAISAARRRHATPIIVPAAVQQETQTFSYKRVEKDRTIFTIRASRTTQFKEGTPALLEDVWITVYGREGNRNDNIHTRECSYDQKSGGVQCKGELTIDIQDAVTPSNPTPPKPMQVKTSNLTFDGQTGEASTPAPVDFSFPQGHGRGVGVIYSTQTAAIHVEHAVEFEMTPTDHTDELPIRVTGSSLEVRRDNRTVTLAGPAIVRQGDRELSAEKIIIELDEEFHARHAIAEGHPAVRGSRNIDSGSFNVAADRFEGYLGPEGWVERVTADGGVTGTRKSPAGTDNFSSGHVEFALEPQHNILRDMIATGGVTAQSQQGAVSQVLNTDALRVKFAPGGQPDQQRIDSAETLAPATIESKNGTETTELHAPKFSTQFAPDGRLDRLFGSGGVEVRSQNGNSPAQVSTAQTLNATFSPDGQWTTVEESGNVHFRQADRQATAAHARIDRAADQIALSGSPVLSDAMSRTTARTVTIGQKSGLIDAEGGVVSTYMPSAQAESVNLGSGPAHVTADALSGSTSSGRVVYSGHSRLWQGESVLEADQITVWRDEKKMQATGNVVAVFPQTSVPTLKPVSQSTVNMSGNISGNASGSASGPTLWQVRAPSLTYWNDQNKARLEGGVLATSQQGSLESPTLDVFLGPATNPASSNPTSGQRPAERAGAAGTGQLTRILAQGGAVVRQGDRRGMADQAEYTSADQKFVLSGGKPTLTDGSGNTTAGRSLTFFVASDTILIDSQAGSRTLTRHRVEK
ncbi:MAG TPA: LptA/OstA family protein [Candidatus Acidoferrales bacterium]|nr:LptA/OstA family protein [Candidatus Acidoferrales bacterium]